MSTTTRHDANGVPHEYQDSETVTDEDRRDGLAKANEVLRQIGVGVRMSIGARNPLSIPYGVGCSGGVTFRVGSGNPRRTVAIRVVCDLYDVTFARVTRGVYRVEDVTEGLMFDQLGEHLIRTLDKVGEGQ